MREGPSFGGGGVMKESKRNSHRSAREVWSLAERKGEDLEEADPGGKGVEGTNY